MLFQVTTDNHIQISPAFSDQIEETAKSALRRFGDRVTRVEVHFTDENSNSKEADNDKRCVIEARLAGLEPVAVTNLAATLGEAMEGAAEKLVKTLDRKIGRLDDRKGRTSFSGDTMVAQPEDL